MDFFKRNHSAGGSRVGAKWTVPLKIRRSDRVTIISYKKDQNPALVQYQLFQN